MTQTNVREQGKCCSGLLSLGVTALFLWLAYRPIVPRYYLVSFSLASPGGNRTLASYQLEIENKCWSMGVYHDDISLALSPGNLTSSVPSFYQGHKKTADKSGDFAGEQTRAGTNATKVFRVGLESGYRYKVWWWKTKRRGVSLGCDVGVGGDGKKTAEKGIRLTSAAAAATSSAMGSLVLAVAVAVIIFC